MFKKRGQGQSWSLDIILALVVFVLIVGIFYTLLSQNKSGQAKDLSLESNTIVSNLDSNTGLNTNLTVMDNGAVNQDKIQTLYGSDYNTIKQQLGIRGDFCIYMIDQYGNIITVQTNNKGTVAGFGSGNSNFTVNGQPCGATLS